MAKGAAESAGSGSSTDTFCQIIPHLLMMLFSAQPQYYKHCLYFLCIFTFSCGTINNNVQIQSKEEILVTNSVKGIICKPMSIIDSGLPEECDHECVM